MILIQWYRYRIAAAFGFHIYHLPFLRYYFITISWDAKNKLKKSFFDRLHTHARYFYNEAL
jgi:hypothetical protein